MNEILTKEAMFVLPFINIYNKNFVNIYSEDQNKPYYDRNFFVVHTADNGIDLQNLIKFYSSQSGFLRQYSYRIDGVFYYVFMFDIRNDIINSYELFISNNHKDIPNNVKSTIITYWIYKQRGCSIFDEPLKRSYIPHSDYIETMADIILNQFV